MSRIAIVVALALLFLGATVRGANGQVQPVSCAPTGQNLFVRDVLADLYLWYQHLPDYDPVAFDTPEAYLDAVRYRPLDSSFSYITSRAASDAFYSDSQFIGFGFSMGLRAGELRVLQVFPESPAQEGGLERGARIFEINGRAVADLLAAGSLDAALGPSQIGVEAEIAFRNLDEVERRARMTKRLVTIPTVSLTRVYDVGSRTVGYVFFRNFVQPSIEALDAAFTEVRAAGVSELVLDLRYNGGGLVSVAQHLASLLGGVRTAGQVFAEYAHNDKNTHRNRTLRFESKPLALALDRVIVITTRSSASASELVINALKPFVPVVVVGDRTYGKPVGQYVVPFCDKVLAPVAFSMRNAQGEGDFFEGIQVTCPAGDDVSRQLGDPHEASLREALTFVATGSCSVVAPLRTDREEPRLRVRGWRALVNAW